MSVVHMILVLHQLKEKRAIGPLISMSTEFGIKGDDK